MRAKKVSTDVRQGQISQAALKIIGEKGLGHLSISAIAKEVGITASNIYRHYKNKDDVLDAVLKVLHFRLLDNVSQSLAESDSGMSQLESILMRHAQMITDNPAILLLMATGGHYGKNEAIQSIVGAYRAALASVVLKAQSEGNIDAGQPVQTVVIMFLGLLLPGAILVNIGDKDFDMMGHVKTAWPLFKQGLKPISTSIE